VIWWLVIVLVAGSLLVLAMAAVPLLRRLDELGIAARRLQLRAVDAQRLVPAVTSLQQRAEQMQQGLTVLQERAAQMQGGHQPTGR
jgi:HAMP domain-containing protein